ncbi:MAG: NAD(P)-binding domain-containing protein [Ferruginibacter sp.]|nr:NAD(P)-binding domain-containing protein [Ferruginibacter sp.]
MLTKQTIVIIGTGFTGKAIAARLASGCFHVLICDKEFSNAETLVNELKEIEHDCDVEAMECSFDGAWEADIIILATHFDEQKEVAGIIKEVVNQKILVSAVQPGTETIEELSPACSQVRALQELLPNTKIVRIFNDDPMADEPVFNKNITKVLIAGMDDKAVEAVSRILESVGVNPTRVDY